MSVPEFAHHRRAVLKAAIALGAGLPICEARAAKEEDPTRVRPQEGDRLVFLAGDRKGETIKPEDVPLGGPQILAYPMDAATSTVRNGSRLNQVVLIRFDPEQLSEQCSANAADGVVAYSAVCTHQACPVSAWKKDEETLYCVCHGSQYDPRDAAKVVHGPAQRPLAMLPLTTEGGVLVAAGSFIGKVGPARS